MNALEKIEQTQSDLQCVRAGYIPLDAVKFSLRALKWMVARMMLPQYSYISAEDRKKIRQAVVALTAEYRAELARS